LAERYASKEYLSETKREILDSISDLARRIEIRDHPSTRQVDNQADRNRLGQATFFAAMRCQ
jgi:hypothetical protein